MTRSYMLFVPHEPVRQPRQRHRVVKPKGKAPYVQNYTPDDDPVHAMKAAVRRAFRAAHPDGLRLDGAVLCDILFVLKRPVTKVWKRKPMPREWCTAKPDRDNLDKAVLDALTGLAWKDDSVVCTGGIHKVIAAGGEEPHIEIRISSAGEVPGDFWL